MSILLIDNGSKRAAATRQLRHLAARLTERTGKTVHPVSLQHADAIDPWELDGTPAQVFKQFLKARLEAGERNFFLLPMFFGISRALTSFVPDTVRELQSDYGDFEYSLGEVLYPLPQGEPKLVHILHDHAVQTANQHGLPLANLVLVDHGSPVARVTQVRNHLAAQLRQQLDADVSLSEAAMERREGPEYDFNGPLLKDWLETLAAEGHKSAIVIMQFLLPGRHAGPGGDVLDICQQVMTKYPGLRIQITPLISEHPAFVDLLADRLGGAI